MRDLRPAQLHEAEEAIRIEDETGIPNLGNQSASPARYGGSKRGSRLDQQLGTGKPSNARPKEGLCFVWACDLSRVE